MRKPTRNWILAGLVLAMQVSLLVASCSDKGSNPDDDDDPPPPPPPPAAPKWYTYEVVNEYPHDDYAYTEGLEYVDSFLYEGTGQEENSTLRRVDLTTGEVLQMRHLPTRPGGGYYFGEGITVFRDRIYQQTWLDSVGFVYSKYGFDSLGQFHYPAKAWGLANDGTRLIMSTGSEYLYFCDTLTYAITDSIRVRDDSGAIDSLNELEYIDGEIWANLWTKSVVVRIDPSNGHILGYIEFAGLMDSTYYDPLTNRNLNGIAYDSANGRIFVTGKYWPKLFEVRIVDPDSVSQ